MCHLTSLAARSGLEVGVLRVVGRSARAAGARRWRGGWLVAAALLVVGTGRLRHQLPVDDRVRAPLPFEARPPDGCVDGVRGGLLRVEAADPARLAVRVVVLRLPL